MKDQSMQNLENNQNIQNAKNCNLVQNNCKNNNNYTQNDNKNANHDTKVTVLKSVKDYEKIKMQAWVKALFTVYPSLPNIIDVIDNIIETRASSAISFSSIYNGANSTYKEIEKVIDMSERKCKLLNIIALIREILSSLSMAEYEIVDMKFFRRMKTGTIADRLEIEERSVFRRINRTIERAVEYCGTKKYNSNFIEIELKGESWIKEIYNKSMEELSSNKKRADANRKKI